MMGSPAASLVTASSISSRLFIPNKTHKAQQHCSSVSKPSYSAQYTHFAFHPHFLRKQSNDFVFCVYALNEARQEDTFLMQMGDFDDESDEFDDLDDESDGGYDGGDARGDDGDDEGMFLPFRQTNKWLENKPPGFGEGKVYDTAIEDKLLEEIEQSRQAQAANIKNLKNNPVKPGLPKNDNRNKKASEVALSGIRVRVVNLPKKKNVLRDLKSAFKEVSGILNIIPAVSGNKKTKDPICKGFAFIDFKSVEDATRFVQQFSRSSVAFGKIHKQIKCEMIDSHCSNFSGDVSMDGIVSAPQLIPDLEGGYNAEFYTVDSFFEENVSDISDGLDNDIIKAELEDVTKNIESFSSSELNDDDPGVEPRMGPATHSVSLKKRGKSKATKKKIVTKERGDKIVRLDLPGSARRLKLKEKAVLTDVFTKYGSKTALASGEDS